MSFKNIYLHDKGDADSFVKLYNGKLVFDNADKSWYFFDGKKWARDDYNSVVNLVENIAVMYERGLETSGVTPTDSLYRFLKGRIGGLRKLNKIKSVVSFASAKMPLKQEWDSDPYLFAVKNGVVNLKTGELRDGKPDDYIKKTSEIEWKGLDEPAPRFEQFLKEVFDNNEEIISFVQRLFGYAMTGLCVEHVFPVFFGAEGRNGKDTLLKIICHVMGSDFSSPISKEVLLSGMKNPGASAPFLFELQGKRFVYADETGEGAKLDEGQVKMLSGGTPFTAKKLYHQPVTIYPQYLIIMTTNDKPEVAADDPAIWERIILLEFNQRFIEKPEFSNEHPVDKFLDNKLKNEAPGVLAWLVKGCLEWQKRKSLDVPDCVKYSTDQYKDESDTIGTFIKDELIVDENSRELSSVLYDSYVEWQSVDGSKKLNKRQFAKKMAAKGFERHRASQGYYYLGVRCKNDVQKDFFDTLDDYIK